MVSCLSACGARLWLLLQHAKLQIRSHCLLLWNHKYHFIVGLCGCLQKQWPLQKAVTPVTLRLSFTRSAWPMGSLDRCYNLTTCPFISLSSFSPPPPPPHAVGCSQGLPRWSSGKEFQLTMNFYYSSEWVGSPENLYPGNIITEVHFSATKNLCHLSLAPINIRPLLCAPLLSTYTLSRDKNVFFPVIYILQPFGAKAESCQSSNALHQINTFSWNGNYTLFVCLWIYFFCSSLKSEWNADLKVSLEIIIVSASVQMIQGKWLTEVCKFRGI